MAGVYKKLVRDRIPEIVEESGERPVTRILEEDEYRKLLLEKLVEETGEVVEAAPDKGDLTKEVGDVQELLFAVMDAFGLDRSEVEALREKRKRERGGFEKKIFLESVE